MKSDTARVLLIINWFVMLIVMLPAAVVTYAKNPLFLQELNFHTVCFILAAASMSFSLLAIGFVEIPQAPEKSKLKPTHKAKILKFEKR